MDSPVDNYLSKIGAIAYHICYISEDLEKDISSLGSKGFKMLIPPRKAVAFEGKRVAFFANLGVGLLEVVECQK